jgi:hypothetical protein
MRVRSLGKVGFELCVVFTNDNLNSKEVRAKTLTPTLSQWEREQNSNL